MVDTDNKNGQQDPLADPGLQLWPEGKKLESWLTRDSSHDLGPDQEFFEISALGPPSRLDSIRESHELLKQFTAVELKTLLNMKRNTSEKAWSLREDLVVLTLPMSNREIAGHLKDRNKEAVKKRLQLLRSKGLLQRGPDTSHDEDDLNGDRSAAPEQLIESGDLQADILSPAGSRMPESAESSKCAGVESQS